MRTSTSGVVVLLDLARLNAWRNFRSYGVNDNRILPDDGCDSHFPVRRSAEDSERGDESANAPNPMAVMNCRRFMSCLQIVLVCKIVPWVVVNRPNAICANHAINSFDFQEIVFEIVLIVGIEAIDFDLSGAVDKSTVADVDADMVDLAGRSAEE